MINWDPIWVLWLYYWIIFGLDSTFEWILWILSKHIEEVFSSPTCTSWYKLAYLPPSTQGWWWPCLYLKVDFSFDPCFCLLPALTRTPRQNHDCPVSPPLLHPTHYRITEATFTWPPPWKKCQILTILVLLLFFFRNLLIVKLSRVSWAGSRSSYHQVKSICHKVSPSVVCTSLLTFHLCQVTSHIDWVIRIPKYLSPTANFTLILQQVKYRLQCFSSIKTS